jgi:hypothetical protein
MSLHSEFFGLVLAERDLHKSHLDQAHPCRSLLVRFWGFVRAKVGGNWSALDR